MKHKITLCCMLIVSYHAIGQQDSIDYELQQAVKDCKYSPTPREEILCTNPVYSIVKLNDMLSMKDTMPCITTLVYYSAFSLLDCSKGAAYDTVVGYCIKFVKDSANKMSARYNTLVNSLRYYVIENGAIPNSAQQFIGSADFYKCTTGAAPLIISYLDLYEEVENLKKLESTQNLNAHGKKILLVSLMRLEDRQATEEYIKKMKPQDDYWDSYLAGFNYARTKAATAQLIKMLNDTTKIIDYIYSDMPNSPFYTTVRTKALIKLSEVVKNFPWKEIDSPCENPHWEQHFESPCDDERLFEQVIKWFQENPSYEIIRKPNYTY